MKTKLLITFIVLAQIASAQWKRINNSPSQAHYIYFYSPSLGYTLKGNEIHKTTNGGTSWTKTTTSFGSFDYISRIYFTSPDTGFISVTNTMMFTYPVSIYRTINGGATWNLLLGPFNNCDVDFRVTNKNAWYFYINTNGMGVDTIHHTTNGGTTWMSSANASVVQYNQLTNNLVVYKDSTNSTNTHFFYKSADGGATWSLLLTDNTPLAGYMDHQFLNNNTNGYVLYYQYNDNDNIPSKIYRTADGGKNWVNYDLPLACKAPQSLHFIDANTGYIISHNTNQSVLYKTIDGGKTWNQDFSALANEYFSGFTRMSEYFGTLYLLGNTIIFNKMVTTSINELEKKKPRFHLFPNPSNGRLIIQSSDLNKKFAIMDITGKEVYSFVMEQDLSKTIDVSFLNTGVYLLKDSETSETILFIKE